MDRTDADHNISTLIYGKLSESARDRPKHRRGKVDSDYAEVKVDSKGYPVVGDIATL